MSNEKILFVEDDEDIRAIAMIALESVGEFVVMQCPGGDEAVQKAEGFAPDLLLLDAMMPGMSGIETLGALRNIPGLADTPAVFMTAKAREAEKNEFFDAGAIGVITKPFDPMTLGDQIRQISGFN